MNLALLNQTAVPNKKNKIEPTVMADQILIRGIFHKKFGAPVPWAPPMDKGGPIIHSEESILLGFGRLNKETSQSHVAIYRLIDGKPRLVGDYTPRKGGNGFQTRMVQHQGPLNWIQGMMHLVSEKKRAEGHYFFPVPKGKEKVDSRIKSLQLPLAQKSCAEAVSSLQWVEPTPFDILAIDELGAPNKIREIEIKSNRLQQMAFNRLCGNLWAANPEFVQLWRHGIARGSELWQSHQEEIANAAISQIHEGLSNELAKHAKAHWVFKPEPGASSTSWRKPFFQRLCCKVGRLVDFYPELVRTQPFGSHSLQVCGSENLESGDTTPVVVGVTGSPMVYKEAQLPAKWEFPVTWSRSPFEGVVTQ